MKKISEKISQNTTQKLEVQEDSLNHISKDQLEKYLEVTNNFLSDDAKEIINWLIEHNSTYVKDFGGENALETFYNKGLPTDKNLIKLYTSIKNEIKNNRILEVPVFQTKEQFNDIVSKKVSLDEIVLDLETEKGRNDVAKKYTPLVYKIALEYGSPNNKNNKSSLMYDELVEAGFQGLVWAMNDYGKRGKGAQKELDERIATARKIAEENGEDPDDAEKEVVKEFNEMKSVKKLTFGQFAAWRIRLDIVGAIRNESHTVRIPVSNQTANKNTIEKFYKTLLSEYSKLSSKDALDIEDMITDVYYKLKISNKKFLKDLIEEIPGEGFNSKAEFEDWLKDNINLEDDSVGGKGYTAKSYNVYGDEHIGHDDDGNSRTIWDVIGDKQTAFQGIDKEETIKAKEDFLKKLKEKVSARNYEWIINKFKDKDDPTKISNEEMAKKWKVAPSSISCVVSNNAIKKLVLEDPELKKLAYNWSEKLEESIHDELEQSVDIYKPIFL